MSAKILDGLALSKKIRNEIKERLESRTEKYLINCNQKIHLRTMPPPCLAVLLCSEDPASAIYVKKKQEACLEAGIISTIIKPFQNGIENYDDPMGELFSLIDWINEDCSIHGIIVQLPLPKSINQYEIFDCINPLKDVDVFSPENVGLLQQGRPRFVPCTPAAIQEILIRNGISFDGKKVAIINRSDVVGKPLHSLLIQNNDQANATITMCHDRTTPERLKQVCLASDIIVVAVGKPNFLTADMVSDGAIVIDVGINHLKSSKKIVGDVDFESVSKKASWITPVPGGIGPMTVTMLLKNTVLAQELLVSASCS